ncbi:MAG: nitroreductase family protein [Pirellulales bacterium]|nr:nitroreductase family protein [Pirellulales bacterium]
MRGATCELPTAEPRASSSGLTSFLELVRARRSTRHFRPDPVPAALLDELLEAARWAPSGFNLQPTHFVVVTDPQVKAQLCPACMNQRQVLEAGATVVFTGDRRVLENHFERVLEQDRAAGAIDQAYENLMRKGVPLSFDQGPLGIGWLWKAVVAFVAERFVPIPKVQAVHKSYWLAKQVSLSAMVFMLAAEAAGLTTCPMEGFGEHAVRRVLGIPSSQTVVLVVPVGYADNSGMRKTRLPLAGRLHRDRW